MCKEPAHRTPVCTYGFYIDYCKGRHRGFAQHHSQQLSRAAVCGDAQNINNAARNMRVAHSFMTGLNAPTPCARAF